MITIMPDPMQSGIPAVDFEIFDKEKQYQFKMKGKGKIKGCFNYCREEDFVPDLDQMLGSA